MTYWVLFYEVVADHVERRKPFREAHLELLHEFHDRGELLLAGALADPVDSAILVFMGDDASVVERFVKEDPYVREGLVTAWTIRKWSVVVGP
ncbi:MAG: YciI-like protein [Acidimicrobiia bacterium]